MRSSRLTHLHQQLLLLKALNAVSLPIYLATKSHSLQINSDLAVLGDMRMKSVLCRWWDKTNPHVKRQRSQGRLGKCGNNALVKLGRRMEIDVCVINDPGTHVVSNKIVVTPVEAVMGAMYLDGGRGRWRV